MHLKPCDLKDLPPHGQMGSNKSRISNLIEEFVDSGYECAEILNYTHKNPSHCVCSFNNSIKKTLNIHNIKAILRSERVFLIKINKEKKNEI